MPGELSDRARKRPPVPADGADARVRVTMVAQGQREKPSPEASIVARLGMKVFYLRTRERKESQQEVAAAIGVRQATLSHVEQGVSVPSAALLLELSRYFDVTPTYLLDDDRGVLPLPSDRWSNRQALVTVGMWVEAPLESVDSQPNGKVLVPLLPGQRFFDEEARRIHGAGARAAVQLTGDRAQQEKTLQRELQGELRAHPQRRGR
jgi:transcriptional regulator with XRE-family HTH domain